jgi:hypothetical protein
MKFVTEACESILRTSQLLNNRPVSALLVGPSGGGKSQTIMRFKAPWIHHTNDITTQGLAHILSTDKQEKLRSIILPDFNIPLSHKSSVVTLTVSNLLSLMSEGTCRIDDGRQEKEIKHSPMSIISAVTPPMYQSHYKKWFNLGFIRRFLILHYNYKLETKREGTENIKNQKITAKALPDIMLDKSKVPAKFDVLLKPQEADEIMNLCYHLARYQGMTISRAYKTGETKFDCKEPALEFAPHLILQAVAKGNALRMKRRKVNAEDIEFLVKLLGFTDPSQPCAI